MNLLGLKLCWGTTGGVAVSGNQTKYISLPTGFFTNVRSSQHDKYGSAVFTSQLASDTTTSQMAIYFSGGSGAAYVNWFVIGS